MLYIWLFLSWILNNPAGKLIDPVESNENLLMKCYSGANYFMKPSVELLQLPAFLPHFLVCVYFASPFPPVSFRLSHPTSVIGSKQGFRFFPRASSSYFKACSCLRCNRCQRIKFRGRRRLAVRFESNIAKHTYGIAKVESQSCVCLWIGDGIGKI